MALGQIKYYKQAGQGYYNLASDLKTPSWQVSDPSQRVSKAFDYVATPYAGNTPQGQTEISFEEYKAGLENAAKYGDEYAKGELAKIGAGQGIYAPNYVDPTMTKFLSDAPTPSEQYYTPEYRATLPPSEQARLNEKYGQANPIVNNTPAGQKEVKLGGGFGYAPDGSPIQKDGTISPTVVNAPKIPGTTNPVASIISSGNLQNGSKGTQVSDLQKLLGVSVDGDFGPKTEAAVRAFQAANNLTVDGIVGPETIAALEKTKGATTSSSTSPKVAGAEVSPSKELPSTGNPAVDSLISVFNNQSPQKSFADVYKEVLTSMGWSTTNEDYKKQADELAALQNEKNDKAQEIKNNPWYSEGKKNLELRKLDNSYKVKEDILTNKLKLLETNISNQRSDARFISGQIMDQLQQSSKLNEDIILKAIDIAEKQAEAEAKNSAPKKVTVADNVANFSEFLKTGKDGNGAVFGNPRGADGFVDPEVYKIAFKNWPGTTQEFLTKFPVAKNINPTSIKLLPQAIQTSTKSSSSGSIEP